jgi:Putative peptidoglycan binding domain
LPIDWSRLRYLSVGGRMRSGGKSPRRAVDRGGRKDSLYTRSSHPVVLDRNTRARQFSPRPAEAWQAAARQSAITSPPLFARVAVVGGIAVLILLLFVTVRPWLPDLTIIRHADASRTTPGTSASPSAATSVVQQPDDVQLLSIPSTADEPTSPLTPTEPWQPPIAIPEPVDTVARPEQLDLNEVEDTKRVQQRLIDLGFLFAPADGIGGQRSRRALQDFRVAQGLGDSAVWDEATQRRLFAAPEPRPMPVSKPEISFVGGWGVDAAQCRQSPVTITARRAKTDGVACEFNSTRQESSNVWRLQARCDDKTERWNANVRFTLSGNKLTWSSERGMTIYVRCPS